MNPSQARQLTLVSLVITGGVVLYDLTKNREQLGSDQSFRAVWSLGLLALLMSVLADLMPQLAGPFAGLVALSVIIGRKGVLGSIVKVGDTVSPAGRRKAGTAAAAEPTPATPASKYPGQH